METVAAVSSSGTPRRLRWSDTDRNMFLHCSGPTVEYIGPGNDDSEAAAIRAVPPFDPADSVAYFEITVLCRGREGYIGIGVSTARVSLERLPGWDTGSIGYHGDDGHIFSGSGRGEAYGPQFSTGDTVGVCVVFPMKSLFFTLNGQKLPFVPLLGRMSSGGLYGTVGLRSQNERVTANFGDKEFRFDIESFRSTIRSRLQEGAAKLDDGRLNHDAMRRLICDYLRHNGYFDSLAALSSSEKEPEEIAQSKDGQRRRSMRLALQRHDFPAAREILERAKNPSIDAQVALTLLEFLHLLIDKGDAESALRLGRESLVSLCDNASSDVRAAVSDVVALLAYSDATEMTVGGKSVDSFRAELQDRVEELTVPDGSKSALELILLHSQRVARALRKVSSPEAVFIQEILQEFGDFGAAVEGESPEDDDSGRR